MRKLHTFKGGIHPPEFKTLSNQTPLSVAPLAPVYHLALSQHGGTAPQPCVQVGDFVLKGQKIALANGSLSACLHAPTSGKVSAIAPKAWVSPLDLLDTTISIEADGLDKAIAPTPLNWQDTNAPEFFHFLREMGLVGLGGAAFPTHTKANSRNQLHTLIVNGAECEPFITCDDRLMREQAERIIEGLVILQHFIQTNAILIGIEDNKPEALAAMKSAANHAHAEHANIEVIAIPTIYPSGADKQLIHILTGHDIARGERATSHGLLCLNVATIYALRQAVIEGTPLIERVVTLTGDVPTPRNVWAKIGTPLDFLLSEVQQIPAPQTVIIGGPMMGHVQKDLHAGLSKGSNCLIVTSEQLLPSKTEEMACIRCGDCAVACPVELQPMDLFWFAKGKNLQKAEEWHLLDCIECGACSYVCPSKIPLVSYYQAAKDDIFAARREAALAESARLRHEARIERLARDKRERAEKLAAHKAKAAQMKLEQAQAAELAAKEMGASAPNAANTELIDTKKAAIEAAMKRAAEKKALRLQQGEPVITPAAAAISEVASTDVDAAKKAAILASKARAAARKAAKAQTEDQKAEDKSKP